MNEKNHHLSELLGIVQKEKPTKRNNYDVVSIPEFFTQFQAEALNAERRVWLETMYALPSHFTDLLAHTLIESAKNDLDVRLYTDGIQRVHYLAGVVASKLFGSKTERDYQHAAALNMQQSFDASGVQYIETREFTKKNWLIFSLLRNHFKLAVVDNTLWLGGLNAGKESDYNRIDYMMRFDSKELVDFIVEVVNSQSELTTDISKQIGAETVLVDRGFPGESVIYDTLLKQLADINNPKTTKVTLLSPWVPDGKLLDMLAQLQAQGAEVKVLTSYHPLSLSPVGIYALVKNYNRLLMKLKRKKLQLLESPLEVHGKMVLIEEAERSVGTITTHNYVSQGIKMGTTEIGISSVDPDFCSSCKDYLQKVESVSEMST